MDDIMSWLLALTFLILGLFWICCQIHNPCTLVSTLDLHGNNMTGAACGAGNAYPSRAPDFTSVCYVVHIVSFLTYEFVLSILSCCPDSQVIFNGWFVTRNLITQLLGLSHTASRLMHGLLPIHVLTMSILT